MRGRGCHPRRVLLIGVSVLALLFAGTGAAAAVHPDGVRSQDGGFGDTPDGQDVPDVDPPERPTPVGPDNVDLPASQDLLPDSVTEDIEAGNIVPDVPYAVDKAYDACRMLFLGHPPVPGSGPQPETGMKSEYMYLCEPINNANQEVLEPTWEFFATGEASYAETQLQTPASSGISPRQEQTPTEGTERSFQGHSVGEGPNLPSLFGGSEILWMLIQAASVAVVAFTVIYLYRRLEGDEVLKHDARSTMMDIVKDRPGINEATLARELDVHPSTVRYHARILEEEGFLTSKADGREIVYFRSDQPTDKIKQELLKIARKPAKRRVIQAVRDTPGLSLSEAARQLDVHPSTVKRHADTLIEKGVLEDERHSGQRVIRLSVQVRDNLNLVDRATAAADVRVQNGA